MGGDCVPIVRLRCTVIDLEIKSAVRNEFGLEFHITYSYKCVHPAQIADRPIHRNSSSTTVVLGLVIIES